MIDVICEWMGDFVMLSLSASTISRFWLRLCLTVPFIFWFSCRVCWQDWIDWMDCKKLGMFSLTLGCTWVWGYWCHWIFVLFKSWKWEFFFEFKMLTWFMFELILELLLVFWIRYRWWGIFWLLFIFFFPLFFGRMGMSTCFLVCAELQFIFSGFSGMTESYLAHGTFLIRFRSETFCFERIPNSWITPASS